MAQIQLRIEDGCFEEPVNRLWDTILYYSNDGWANVEFDWNVAPADDTSNTGGLEGRAQLRTAVIIQLFSDKRVPDDHPYVAKYPDVALDRRGWWGDSVGPRPERYEAAIGSLLWLLKRAPLNEETRLYAEQFAMESLQGLLSQGAVARVNVSAEIVRSNSMIGLCVELFNQSGDKIYDEKFGVHWRDEEALQSRNQQPTYK